MPAEWTDRLRDELRDKKAELEARLDRIKANLRRGLESDSKEQAKQLEDQEVVDALGNEAREELGRIASSLRRMDAGTFNVCSECGRPIGQQRLEAWHYALECIDCATDPRRVGARG